MTPHLPPIWRRCIIRSTKSSSVLVVAIVSESLISLLSMLPLNGGFARTMVYLSFSVNPFESVSCVFHLRFFDPVEDHVHKRDPNHRTIKIESVECVGPEFFPVFRIGNLITEQVMISPFWVFLDLILACVFLENMLVRIDKEPGSTAGRVTNPVIDIRINEIQPSCG